MPTAKKADQPQFPTWVNNLAGEMLGEFVGHAKAVVVSKAQTAFVEPLAERVGRAMAKAEGEKYSQVWKSRAHAALAELARRPRG